MRTFLVTAAVLGFLSLPVRAQDRIEVFGGYEYLHLGSTNINPWVISGGNLNGWNVAATGNLTSHFGIEGNFGGAYYTWRPSPASGSINFGFYHFSGGPVAFTNIGRLKPFAHVLFGGDHLTATGSSGISASANGYTIMAGGGLDARVNRMLAIRVGEVDWFHYNLESTTVEGEPIPSVGGGKNVKFSTGIVFRF